MPCTTSLPPPEPLVAILRLLQHQALAGGAVIEPNVVFGPKAVIESGALCEGALCYTGDLYDPARAKYDLKYYVGLAKQLEKAGAHILGIKDMAGVCKPRAAAELVRVLKQEVGLPIHFHTHDTSGISAASVLAAIEAGCDAVDGALDSMSGLTSQPNLGSIAAALKGHARDPGMDLDAMQALSHYWEGVRPAYAPFEAEMRAGTSDVYNHEMPGGQYTNLREQARAADPDAAAAFVARPVAGKWLADLFLLARRRLVAAGVIRISGGGVCTVSAPQHFYSYRRDGVTGRFASLVWLDTR